MKATFLLLLTVPLLSGCVASKHKLAGKVTPPVRLDLGVVTTLPAGPTDEAGKTSAVQVTLHSVIVYRGAGSWKRQAYWDEYVVSIANRGTTPFTVESASVTDFEDKSVAVGDDPWALEKQSRAWQSDIGARDIGAAVAIGATPFALYGVALAGLWGGATTSVVVTFHLLPLAAPAFIVASASIDENRKGQVEAEFERRRLVLPAAIAPDQVKQGSLFFRISPGPRRLTLRCSTDGRLQLVTLDLAPLAGLHLKTPAKHVTPPSPRR